MTFKEPHPENPQETVWGCPRFSVHGAGWLIDWFHAEGRGLCEGSSIAKGESLEWIKTHPEEVHEMQIRLQAWQKTQIPY